MADFGLKTNCVIVMVFKYYNYTWLGREFYAGFKPHYKLGLNIYRSGDITETALAPTYFPAIIPIQYI